MAAVKYLLGAAGLTAAYLYTSYLTDKNNMFEGKPILSYFAWLNVKYFNNMGASRAGESRVELAKEFGVTRPTISPGAYNDRRTFEQQIEAQAAYDRSRGDPSK